MRKLLLLTVVGALMMALSPGWAEIPHLINYQGMLTQTDGTPLDGTHDLTFKIYSSESGNDSLWWEYHAGIQVTDGLFNIILGSIADLDLPFDEDYWLGITVGTESELSPRIRLTSVGYAYRARWAERSDTSDYALSSPSGPGDYTWTFRITDTGDTTITTGGNWGIARYGNTLYGNADSTHVNLGVECTTGTSGQNYTYCSVGGGLQNTASEGYTTVGGGNQNTSSGYYATVGGGNHNTSSGNYATVGGGSGNTASGDHATVGGGYHSTSSAYSTTVGGGYDNTATADYATIGGGRLNSASEQYATVGGGSSNTASGQVATVGGGSSNTASGVAATVGGGRWNTASGYFATVAGGLQDTASGECAIVGGGRYNTASGDYSFAAGRRAKANHLGTFVWADSSVNADFASTGNNQFLIRAAGGVGIGTTSPLRDLHVAGSGFAEIQLEKTNTPKNKWHLSLWENGLLFVETDIGYRLTLENGGNVGIGTTNPAYKLDVIGIINCTGGIKKSGVNYTHPDYVFESNYKLMPLDKLKEYVFEYKCLPNVISAEDVKKNDGFKMDELLIQMLEKIEEQTLYIFQLENRIAELERAK